MKTIKKEIEKKLQYSLSIKEQEKIIRKAAKQSMNDQDALIERYKKTFEYCN